MTTKNDDGPRSWTVTAAYLYTLDLDQAGLAWEYLRRNAGYRADWLASGRSVNGGRWGLRQRRSP